MPVRLALIDGGGLPAGEPEAVEAEAAPEPPVFVRAIAVPPALPWEQARAARLDGVHNAPLPLSELAFQLRRLAPWAPGRPGRFAAVYARHADVGDGLSTMVELDGERLAVRFHAPRRRAEQARRAALALVGGGLGAALALIALVSALVARAEAGARLEALELAVGRRLAQARAGEALQQQAQALDALNLRERRAGRVLDDLAWAARGRAPEGQVEAFFWRPGLLAVEARGETPPFSSPDRPVQRSPEPVRPGVWLWGVEEEGR